MLFRSLVLVTVTMGAGGQAIPFQLTVLEGTTVQLPAGLVSVDVELVNPPAAVVMRVSGLIQRGTANNDACLIQQIAVINAATPQRGPIPNFATGLRIDAAANSPWWSNQFQFVVGAYTFLGPTWKNLYVTKDWLPVSRSTRLWQIAGKPSATEIAYGTFTANLIWRIEP